MPFASELDIRNEAFLYDYQYVASERLQLSLHKAHQEILLGTSLTDESAVAQEIIRAETLLTISHFFRSMAIADAVAAEDIRTSSMTVNEHARVSHFLEISHRLWHEAWSLLRPYWQNTPPASL